MTDTHPRLLDRVTVPTGPKAIRIGALTLRAPDDATLAAGPSGLTYLLTGGTVYCFSPRGQEISVPATVQAPLRRSYFASTP
ncbi:hypothetical protein [Microbacterium sp. 16-032]|uniref:hypothetical protein n=1 Tax=Microbacterium sp. 16-032 TaxID=3239808 RepID=UPI0034E25FB9